MSVYVDPVGRLWADDPDAAMIAALAVSPARSSTSGGFDHYVLTEAEASDAVSLGVQAVDRLAAAEWCALRRKPVDRQTLRDVAAWRTR